MLLLPSFVLPNSPLEPPTMESNHMVMVIPPSMSLIPMLAFKLLDQQFTPHLSHLLSDPKMRPQLKNWDLKVSKLAKMLWTWLELWSKVFFPPLDPSSKMVPYKPNGAHMLFLTLKMLKSSRNSCKLPDLWSKKFPMLNKMPLTEIKIFWHENCYYLRLLINVPSKLRHSLVTRVCWHIWLYK